jgi:hypothetical protein
MGRADGQLDLKTLRSLILDKRAVDFPAVALDNSLLEANRADCSLIHAQIGPDGIGSGLVCRRLSMRCRDIPIE